MFVFNFRLFIACFHSKNRSFDMLVCGNCCIIKHTFHTKICNKVSRTRIGELC